MKTLARQILVLSVASLSCGRPAYGREPNKYDSLTAVEKLFERKYGDQLSELDRISPHKFRSSAQPWMTRSWHMSNGLIADRYMDGRFSSLRSFENRLDYIRRYPMIEVAAERSKYRSRSRNTLSPAEKYDLLVGDSDSTLASRLWEIAENQTINGGIQPWMGLCDGSSAATFMLPEPVKNVTLYDSSHDPVLFYASDIKALAALLYSEITLNVPIVGGRCDREFKGAPRPGLDLRCESLNPAAWHRVVLTSGGSDRDGVFLDHTPSLEVWNTALMGYEYTYYNPLNKRKTSKLEEAVVPIASVRDEFSSLRSRQASQLVGVNMEVLTTIGHSGTRQGSSPAKLIRTTYVYDLELDSQGRIVGGEWHISQFPDFIWILPRNYDLKSEADRRIGISEWDGENVPASWLLDIKASSRKAQPMKAIVDKLVRLSAGER